jgi:hypothetical protein
METVEQQQWLRGLEQQEQQMMRLWGPALSLISFVIFGGITIGLTIVPLLLLRHALNKESENRTRLRLLIFTLAIILFISLPIIMALKGFYYLFS